MRLVDRPAAAVALLLVLLIAVSCQRFFLPVAAPSDSSEEKQRTIHENQQQQKYFILRHGSGNYAISKVEVDQQHQQLKGQLSSLPTDHQVYAENPHKYRFRKSAGEQTVLNEVHLYMPGKTPLDTTGVISLPLDSIQKIEVIEFDRGRTTTSYILGGLGYTIGAMAVAAVIVALTKSSCPFVSVYDGEQYVVQGELFGGAIYPSLQRDDYLPLRAHPLEGSIQVKISNELQEKQFTDFADLLVITHEQGVRALTDRNGKFYTVGSTQVPVKALLNGRQDMTPALGAVDKWSCLFNDTTAKDHINELVLHFDKPGGQKSGKLVLQVKNSYWFDYLYGEFTSAFGSYYNQWVKKQKKVPATELDQWALEQHIPLQVSLKTPEGWKEVEQLKTVGPLANREVMVPLDLQGVEGGEVVIKLSTGFMFWELDGAGIDYSAERPFTVQTLKPFEGVDEKGADVLPVLAGEDGKYLDQPQPGNAAVLKYRLPQQPAAGQALSVVLHTKGYYEHVRHYKGKPRLSFLRGFKEAGAFAAFSRQKYDYVRSQNIIALNQ
jgi:hypothetical protein